MNPQDDQESVWVVEDRVGSLTLGVNLCMGMDCKVTDILCSCTPSAEPKYFNKSV